MNKYTIDTHALVWYLARNSKITQSAVAAINSVLSGDAHGYISITSLLELLWITKIKDQRLKQREPDHPNITGLRFEDVVESLKNYETLTIVATDMADFAIIGRNVEAGLELHDSIIVMLAMKTISVLITGDTKIRESRLVEVLW